MENLDQKVDHLDKYLKYHIDSGEYFSDSVTWYTTKYVAPLSHRSYLSILVVILSLIFLGLTLNIYNIFPIKKQVEYFIEASDRTDQSIKIIKANYFDNDVEKSIADIFLKNYVIKRESYDYNSLKKQSTFISNNSTRIIFNQFFNYINIDNPSSPIIKYQEYIKRYISILSVNQVSKNEANIKFSSRAFANQKLIEDQIWEVTLEYEMDKINAKVASGSRFNFIVTNYKSKLLEDHTS